MDRLNDKLCYGAILLFGFIGVSFNSVIKPRDLTLGTENRNWMNADQACQKDGLKLLSSITIDNMVDILTLMNLWKDDGFMLSSVWVGLTRHKDELGFKWDSCSEVIPNDQLPWLSGHPMSTPVETCVIIDKQSLKLKMTTCFNQYQYICEKPRDKCWFDVHLMQATTDAKLNVGTFSQEGCEDQCRKFVMGSQECVLIEYKGTECFIVKSDKQYIDDSPPFIPSTSSYPVVGVKRCLARSHRDSLMTHVAYYSLPPREPCPSPSSSFLSSADSHYLIYSSPVSVSSMEVSSYMETSREYDTDMYLSSTENTDMYLSSTEITDIYLSSTESTDINLSSTKSNVFSSTKNTDINLSSTDSNVLSSTDSNVLFTTEITYIDLSSTEITNINLSSTESKVLSSTEITDMYVSSTEITDIYLSSTEITVLSTDGSYQTELHTPFGNSNTDSELIIQTLDVITLSFDSTLPDYMTDSIGTSLQASKDALDTWLLSVTYSSSIMPTPSSLSPSMPFLPTTTDIVLPSATSSIPYQPIYSRTDTKLCRCICLNNNSSVHGLTQTKLAEIRKKLFVDTSTLSSTRRKLTSAEDHRPSAIITGQLGLVVLILVFVFFLILDAQRFIVAIYEFMKKKCTKTVVP